MAEVNYEKNPIINSVSNQKYDFTPYNENTLLKGKVFESRKLKIKVRGSSDRYNFSVPLNIRIQFLTRGDYDVDNDRYEYTDSNYQNITINPYSDSDKVSYKVEEISLNGNYVKSIQIIGNVDELKIYKEAVSVTSDNFKDYAKENGISGGTGDSTFNGHIILYEYETEADVENMYNNELAIAGWI